MIFLGRSPDTATPGDLRPYQLHMPDNGDPVDALRVDRGPAVLLHP